MIRRKVHPLSSTVFTCVVLTNWGSTHGAEDVMLRVFFKESYKYVILFFKNTSERCVFLSTQKLQ